MKQSMIRLFPFLCLTALNLTAAAHADMLPLTEARESRLGGIVVNSKTNEELYLGCVEKNETGTCVQYRFIAQLGSAARMLGNQEVQPFELSSVEISQSHPMFSEKKVLPTLAWMGKGFKVAYGPGDDDSLASMFASMFPMLGLPGIGTPVLVACAVYDAGRLVVLTPVEVVKSVVRNLGSSRTNKAYFHLFDTRVHATSESTHLNSKRFIVLKAQLIRLSTAATL